MDIDWHGDVTGIGFPLTARIIGWPTGVPIDTYFNAAYRTQVSWPACQIDCNRTINHHYRQFIESCRRRSGCIFRSESGSITVLLAKMAQIIEDSRKILPVWILERLPSDAIAFKEEATIWLRTHANQLQVVGKEAGRITAHIIIGMIVGGMIALRDALNDDQYQPFARALVQRAWLFGDAFKRVVFAQVRIASINALFTGVYLAIILPMLGIELPLVKTLIAITFVAGLIPVVGNLISNTVIVVVSLSQSLGVAIGSLLYLIVIHKLEYFLNARIVGGQIRANAWELLITMLVMEAIFGLAGIVAAPIYYAYIKSELRIRNLI